MKNSYLNLHTAMLSAGIFLMLLACSDHPNPISDIKDSLTFYASFDDGFDADIALGDSRFYTAPSWANRSEPAIFNEENEHLAIHSGAGRYSDALWIDNSYTPVYFYKGADNITYIDENWSGTVSFWLKLNPDEDLPSGYSDPIQLTSRSWNDGALFVDFTDDSVRIFRFAFFADREVWDPDRLDWDDIPFEQRPMIEVTEPVFSRDEWTHIAFSFQNFNTGEPNGVINSYINGEFYAALSDREQTITWNPDNVAIWLGYNYRGYFDELSIFSRALNESEILEIYSLPSRLGDFLD